jgi:PPOX class probable F420-dependent enzyme
MPISRSAAAFLDAPLRLARVSTVNADGSPHVVPMWFVRNGERFEFTSRRRRATVRNLLRDDRIAFVVDDDNPRGYGAVVVDGRAHLLDHEAAAAVRRIAQRYLPGADGDRYADYMLGQPDRVAFLVIPHRISDWGIDAPDSVARLLRGDVL